MASSFNLLSRAISPPPYVQTDEMGPPDTDHSLKHEYESDYEYVYYPTPASNQAASASNGPPPPVPPHSINPDLATTSAGDKLNDTNTTPARSNPIPIPNGSTMVTSPSIMSPRQFSFPPKSPSPQLISIGQVMQQNSSNGGNAIGGNSSSNSNVSGEDPRRLSDARQPTHRTSSADDRQHVVLVPLGKTGQGKSSLLNSIFGYEEFRASARVKSVTDRVAERTAFWQVGRKKILTTVVDTPGFADTNMRDAEFIPQTKEYIINISKRLGIDAFLMVFKISTNGDQIITILQTFSKMMSTLRPATYWQHVVLVFTCVDFAAAGGSQMIANKVFITQTLMPKIQRTFNLDHQLPTVFLSTSTPVCAYARGLGDCDCVEANKYLLDCMRRLWRTVRDKGRWVYEETIEEPIDEPSPMEDEVSNTDGADTDSGAYVAPPEEVRRDKIRQLQHRRTILRSTEVQGF